MKQILGLAILFFISAGVTSPNNKLKTIVPNAELWRTECNENNLKKILGEKGFVFRAENNNFDIDDAFIISILGEKYEKHWDDKQFTDVFRSFSDESDGNIFCLNKKIVQYRLSYEGSESSFLPNLRAKYGEAKQEISLFEWVDSNDTPLHKDFRSTGKKKNVGNAYILNKTSERIFLASSKKLIFGGAEMLLLFYNPELFSLIKQRVDVELTKTKKQETEKNNSAKESLPTL